MLGIARTYVKAYMLSMIKLAMFFAALADTTRLRLLHLMKEGEVCVCVLQGVLQTNQPKISRHLAYLKRAGLVKARREGRWSYYSLNEMSAERHRILQEAMRRLAIEPQIQSDLRKLGKICCGPAGQSRRSRRKGSISGRQTLRA